MIVWHVKDHSAVLVMTNEAAADSVSELHVTVCEAADNADAQEEKQMKWSCVNWCQEVMKNQSTDINAHKKNDAVIQKMIDNMRLSACDNQHQTDLHQKAVHMQLQEENQRDRKKEEWENKNREFDENVRFTWTQHWTRRNHENTTIWDVKQHNEVSEHSVNEDVLTAEWEMTSVFQIKQHWAK